MKTALEALKTHRANFWLCESQEECNRHVATESQLIAYVGRQKPDGDRAAIEDIRGMDDYARSIMGVSEGDQFYA